MNVVFGYVSLYDFYIIGFTYFPDKFPNLCCYFTYENL